MTWLNAILLLLVGLALIFSVLTFYGANRWRAATRELRTRLQVGRAPVTPTTYDAGELDGLPAPVQRYFRLVLTNGQPIVAAARIKHDGQFNLGESKDRWVPFASDQLVIIRRPGFDWDARIRAAPGIGVFVHDAYVGGNGILQAKLLGLVTLAEQRGTPELAHGQLMRFFAEMAWYPTALLPSQGMRWEAIDGTSARATLVHTRTTVSLDFAFGADGLIETVRSPGRYRSVGGEQVVTPWQGHLWGYQVREGMRVPLDGEIAWLLPEGPKPYWRGTITEITYEWAQPRNRPTSGSP